MIKRVSKNDRSQVKYWEDNEDILGQKLYIHYNAQGQSLVTRGTRGSVTIYPLLGHFAGMGPPYDTFNFRIRSILIALGASNGTIKVLEEAGPYLSWLYTLGTHRHVKIAKTAGFRFWPSDIKKLVGIEGTYATPS